MSHRIKSGRKAAICDRQLPLAAPNPTGQSSLAYALLPKRIVRNEQPEQRSGLISKEALEIRSPAMNRSHLKSYSEVALLLAALLTGSLMTTLTPAARPDRSSAEA